ncbi:hypothetical protein [Parvimonas micra]|uniref:Uncharacterized protein n=1 Tax=Parvimonas micra TaxID=33033 RepID=A0A9X3HKX5_9FIRM|nr:hypothetical protein [Parvimonas micra]MCZ7408205.1 hypothetical protein [Parvimonas micra]MCZ7410132.1 hypothetical protein [Parvimonas micra]MCZ7411961.1 hypothetical protein [Parvimonas micra]WBB37042.1 hypothetical protein NM218_00230 [Parvimonas micra]
MNVIHNNWKSSNFTKDGAEVCIGNRMVHLQGENYSRYMYPLFNEFTYVNSVDRLYNILLTRISEDVSFENFIDIINKLLEHKILILVEDKKNLESQNSMNISIFDFSYSGVAEKISEISSLKSDLYVSSDFLIKDRTKLKELDFYNLKSEIKKVKNNKIVICIINRNNFNLLKVLCDLDLTGNECIIPVFVDSNVLVIGSIISKEMEFLEKQSLCYQFESICRRYIFNRTYFECNEDFLISSIGLLDKELKEIAKILNGNVGFSKICNNAVIYNHNTGNLYYEKLLKYKFELERILRYE